MENRQPHVFTKAPSNSGLYKRSVAIALGCLGCLSIGAGMGDVNAIATESQPITSRLTTPMHAQVKQDSTRQRMLGALQDLVRRRRKKGGSRSEGLCLISPIVDSPPLWHRNPAFIWQGFNTTGLIRGEYDINDAEFLWTEINPSTFDHPIETTSESERNLPFNFTTYEGTPLSSGTYTWLFFINLHEGPVLGYPFQLMGTVDYERHSIALNALETELEITGISVSEAKSNIAIAQAEYFAEYNLGDDAFQALFSVETPSPELTEIQNILLAVFETACSDREDVEEESE